MRTWYRRERYRFGRRGRSCSWCSCACAAGAWRSRRCSRCSRVERPSPRTAPRAPAARRNRRVSVRGCGRVRGWCGRRVGRLEQPVRMKARAGTARTRTFTSVETRTTRMLSRRGIYLRVRLCCSRRDRVSSARVITYLPYRTLHWVRLSSCACATWSQIATVEPVQSSTTMSMPRTESGLRTT